MDDWCFGIIMYKLIVGVFPFKGKVEDDYKRLITSAKLKFPESINISSQAVDLIK